MSDESTTGAGAVVQPVDMYATGPDGTAQPTVERQSFKNNADAFDAKQELWREQQSAPNPTTDERLAREAFGEPETRGYLGRVIGVTADGDRIHNHGGVAVDEQGHALGHASDVERAVALKESLQGGDGTALPVTAEAHTRYLNEQGGSPDAGPVSPVRYSEPAEAKLGLGEGEIKDDPAGAKHNSPKTAAKQSTRSADKS